MVRIVLGKKEVDITLKKVLSLVLGPIIGILFAAGISGIMMLIGISVDKIRERGDLVCDDNSKPHYLKENLRFPDLVKWMLLAIGIIIGTIIGIITTSIVIRQGLSTKKVVPIIDNLTFLPF